MSCAAVTGLLLESLIRLAARASAGTTERDIAPETVGPALLAAILEYVESRLNDPSLTVAEVAAHFGIGKRYVHKLFEPTGESFSRHVLDRRLERVAADLTAPELARMPIAGIRLPQRLLRPVLLQPPLQGALRGDAPGHPRDGAVLQSLTGFVRR